MLADNDEKEPFFVKFQSSLTGASSIPPMKGRCGQRSSPYDNDEPKNHLTPKFKNSWNVKCTAVLIVLTLAPFFICDLPWSRNIKYIPAKITKHTFEEGLEECNRIKRIPSAKPQEPRLENPRFKILSSTSRQYPQNNIFIIKHATLIDGDGKLKNDVDILVQNGMIKIVQVGIDAQSIAPLFNASLKDVEIIDVRGRYVTPGLVDMHSHTGTDSWPALDATDDTNEMTSSPVMPYLRSIDGFNPHDPAIQIINSGGVTTSLILPGSGNLMGGEAYVIKHRKPKSNRIADMLIYANANQTTDGKIWRQMKMACGENIKTFYGQKGITPNSRLGEGGLFREQFHHAKSVKERQDQWCELAYEAVVAKGNHAYAFVQEKYPFELHFESLVALLRDEVKLQNHCYETEDLELMVRHSHEFGYKITAFHHALEAWQVPDMLAKENISAAIFADHWGYKKEAYDTSVRAATILTNAGVKVAFKSDHPVLNAQHLVFEAQKAHHYGLDSESAFKAVSGIPAELLGLSNRIGFARSGYDADLVIWNKHPLYLGATPLKIYIDGHVTFEHPTLSSALKIKSQKQPKIEDAYISKQNLACESKTYNYIVLTNISTIYVDEKTTLTGSNLRIVVKDGLVACLGEVPQCVYFFEKIEVIDMHGGVIYPGMVLGISKLGLEEISAEETTKNGLAKGFDLATGGTRAVDGLRVGMDASKMLTAAYNAGVLIAVANPKGKGVVHGQPVSFKIGAKDFSSAVIDEVTGVTVAIGNNAKDENESKSIAGQILLLRKILRGSVKRIYVDRKPKETIFDEIVTGNSILFVRANEYNDIQRFIALKKEIEDLIFISSDNSTLIKATLVEGAEAWKVASDLAAASINVMLLSARCTPGSWETRNCILPNGVGNALDYINTRNISMMFPSAHILLRHGIIVGVGFKDDNFARGLMWEAAWIYQDSKQAGDNLSESGITPQEAIGLVTWNVADITGVTRGGRIVVGEEASFVGNNYDPILGHGGKGGLASHVRIIVNGESVTCNPIQT